ncbi:hypothetical protein ACFQ0M_10660 [Kitasatospora aburaviensis]
MLGGAAQDPAVGTLVSEVLQREMVDRIAARIGGADARRRACDFAAHLAGLIMARYVLRLEPLASLPPDEIARTHLPPLRLALRPRPASPGRGGSGPQGAAGAARLWRGAPGLRSPRGGAGRERPEATRAASRVASDESWVRSGRLQGRLSTSGGSARRTRRRRGCRSGSSCSRGPT